MNPNRGLLSFSVLSLLMGAWISVHAADITDDPYEGLDVLARVINTIQTHYVDPIGQRELVWSASEGMLDSLDTHSHFFTKEQYRLFSMDSDGQFEGIGVEVREVPEGVEVLQVFSGGPALRDGLLVGDLITRVDQTSIEGMALTLVSKLIRGPRGSDVQLELLRTGVNRLIVIQTQRDQIVIPPVTGEWLNDDVIYLHLIQFQTDCADALWRKWTALTKKRTAKRLILDLRDNPGGLLREAVAVTDLFLDEGVIVSTQERQAGETFYRATPGGFDPDLQVIVLINGQSASASEIVAGALQDTHRATLVGTQSYGKGSVQSVFENTDGSALKLTIGAYYTPSGEPITKETGRVPDHLVPYPRVPTTVDQLKEEVERLPKPLAQRQTLLDLIATLPEEEARTIPIDWGMPLTERLISDPQLAAALRYSMEEPD